MSITIPVGTIVAFGGSLDEAAVATLKTQGWLPCDGADYVKRDYAELALSIESNYGGEGGASGTFNVPDLRGMFLRGTDHDATRDPSASQRTESNKGGAIGNKVGSLEHSTTKPPNNPFTSSEDGAHTHPVPHAPIGNNAYAIAGSHYGLWNSGSVGTSTNGKHSHTLTDGFDNESRPINTYVNYIIKYQ